MQSKYFLYWMNRLKLIKPVSYSDQQCCAEDVSKSKAPIPQKEPGRTHIRDTQIDKKQEITFLKHLNVAHRKRAE